MEGGFSSRQLSPAPYGGEWSYSFLQPVDSTLVYSYRCINFGFIYSSTSAEPWTAWKGVFIQDPPHGKPSTAASTMGSWAQSLESWLVSNYFFRWTTLQFVGLDGRVRVLYTIPVNAAFQSTLSNDVVAKQLELCLGCNFVSSAIQFAMN